MIKTIYTILQVFHEGAIIRSFDQKRKEIILKIANDISWKLIWDNQEDYWNNDIKIIHIDSNMDTSEFVESSIDIILNIKWTWRFMEKDWKPKSRSCYCKSRCRSRTNPAETSDTRKSSSRGTTPTEKENLILRS